MKMTCRLYLITPPILDPERFRPHLAATLEAGDVACVQLRLKTPHGEPEDRETVRAAAKILMPEAHEREVVFLINDDAELARDLGADGVHVGQDDVSARDARACLGPHAIVGVTCHNSRHLAMQAAEQGADYVAFGAFFPTPTKIGSSPAEVETLKIWSSIATVPCVAIGGITPLNAHALIEAGADFLAVSSGVWNDPNGPGAALKAFNILLSKH